MKVLLVEDDISSLSYLEITLKHEHIDYRIATDGAIGLNVFLEYQPDLILSDINMAELTGLQLLERVKAIRPETIVVMLTAYNSEQYVIEAMKLGASNYLKKPIHKEAFLALLRKYNNIISMHKSDKQLNTYQVGHSFSLQFQSNFEIIPSIVNLLVNETDGILESEKQLDVRLGLSELLLNSVEHGNLAITYQEKTEAIKNNTLTALYRERISDIEFSKRQVDIRYTYSKKKCTWIITDQGKGFDYNSVPNPITEDGLLRLHGRGIFICRFQFEEMEYIGLGNQVRVVKNVR